MPGAFVPSNAKRGSGGGESAFGGDALSFDVARLDAEARAMLGGGGAGGGGGGGDSGGNRGGDRRDGLDREIGAIAVVEEGEASYSDTGSTAEEEEDGFDGDAVGTPSERANLGLRIRRVHSELAMQYVKPKRPRSRKFSAALV
jgi:hypothetical protein